MINWKRRAKELGAFALGQYRIWQRARYRRRRMVLFSHGGDSVLDAQTREKALAFLGGLVSGYTDLRWHEYYSHASGVVSPYYLPEDIFFALVLPEMNPAERAWIIRDKNQFDLIKGWPALPATLGRVMNGRLLDADYLPTTLTQIESAAAGGRLVVKPTRSTGSGKHVAFIAPSELRRAVAGRWDAIIQRAVVPHERIATFNPDSTNTIRVTTYRKLDGEIVVLGSFLRMGRVGKPLDNASAGGLFCGIDANGRLHKTGYDLKLQPYTAHPDSGIVYEGYKIPHIEELHAAIVTAHAHTPWIDYGSWDTAIDAEGQPVVIENNVGTSLIVPYLANGPIFEKVADDLKRRIRNRRYSRLFGFV